MEGYNCPTDNCSAIWSKIACKPNQTLEERCFCPTHLGLYRNSKGDCVTAEECISQNADDPSASAEDEPDS